MPKDKYDITILMLEKYGGFLESIPAYVQVKYLDGYQDLKKLLNRPPKETILRNFKNRKAIKGLSLLLILLLSRLTGNKGIFFKYVLRNTQRLQTEYDIDVVGSNLAKESKFKILSLILNDREFYEDILYIKAHQIIIGF